MVEGCGNKCVKYFFWLINFLFFILGAIILGLSIWMIVDKNSLSTLANSVHMDMSYLHLENFNYLLYVAVGIGAALLILGFLGCCGSCCESLCAISLYFGLVLILFIVEIVAAVLYFVNKDSLREGFVNVWRSELVSKYTSQQQIRQILDQIQTNFQCCGASGCSDYIQYGTFPTTCQCATVTQAGCAVNIWNMMEKNLIYVAFVGIVVLFVEILAMIFSCVVMNAVRVIRKQQQSA